MTKCIKIPLFYIESAEISFKDFCTEFREIQMRIRSIKNKISTDFWALKQQHVREHEESGAWPKFSKLNYSNDRYHAYKSDVPMYNTGNLSQCIKSEVDSLQSHWKEVLSGKRTIDSFKSFQPVVLHARNVRMEQVGPEYIAAISVFSNEVKKKYGVKNGIVRFKMYLKTNSIKAIVNRCISGEYKICASTIGCGKPGEGKKKFELSLTYSFEKEKERELDKEKVLGVDLGIVNAYYLATNFDENRDSESGGDIEHFRIKTEARKRKLSRLRSVCMEGSIGHGYQERTRPVNEIQDKIARYRDHKNHLMSRRIIDSAVKYGCGTIQMEDLSGISAANKFLKNWPYYDLQMKIKQKAAEAGIDVKMINPRYTSQRCSKCGYIHADNRPNQSTFLCQSCGYSANADYNAAKNISTVGIENIISSAITS